VAIEELAKQTDQAAIGVTMPLDRTIMLQSKEAR